MELVDLIPVYNPLNEDFSVFYDVNGDSDPKEFTVPANEIMYFDPIIANHVKKHLAEKIVWAEGAKPNFDDAFKEALKRVSVDEL